MEVRITLDIFTKSVVVSPDLLLTASNDALDNAVRTLILKGDV
jgi:hypothetical protein